MNVAAFLAALNLAHAAIEWLRNRGRASWPELATVAAESLIDHAIAAGASIEQARELFEGAALQAMAAVGVSQGMFPERVAREAADAAVEVLRRRAGALAFARAARLLPELAEAAAGVLGAFSAAPVVNVRPEDVRMKLVPWNESGSATTEPPSDGVPPLPASGPLDRKG